MTVLAACPFVSVSKQTAGRTSHAAVVESKYQPASDEATRVHRWVVDSKNNHGLPYLIVDKVNASVFAFDGHGHLQGATAALLGKAKGDGSVAGIGDRTLSAILPEDRTTPAGRFMASLDHDVHGQEILVIDYETALSLHAVIKGTAVEQRAKRLESPTAQDNRISYGCINVPADFYRKIISPSFAHTFGVVYILPEMGTASDLFGIHPENIDP